MSTALLGIDDWINRLEKIAEECGDKPVKEARQKDEFLRTKQRIYELLEQVREDIRERRALLKTRGNCYQTIEKGHAIRQNLEELKLLPHKLQELHKRAQRKRTASARKEELQARYQDIRVLKRHIDEVKALFAESSPGAGGAADVTMSGPLATMIGLGPRDAAQANEEDARRSLTAEEEEALADMKKRDAELEKQVGEVGRVIDRLGPLAQQIGITADSQRLRVEAMTQEVGNADKDISSMNKKIKEVMKYEQNTNRCCQMILGIALLCCIGFVFQQLDI